MLEIVEKIIERSKDIPQLQDILECDYTDAEKTTLILNRESYMLALVVGSMLDQLEVKLSMKGKTLVATFNDGSTMKLNKVYAPQSLKKMYDTYLHFTRTYKY